MTMVPRVDESAREFGHSAGHHYDLPEARFGLDSEGQTVVHIVRDEVPAVNPEILDFMEKQEVAERELQVRLLEERGGQIITAATVHVSGSYYL